MSSQCVRCVSLVLAMFCFPLIPAGEINHSLGRFTTCRGGWCLAALAGSRVGTSAKGVGFPKGFSSRILLGVAKKASLIV